MSIENSVKTYPILHTMNWIEIIDKAFHLYRKYFRLFIGIAFIYFIVDFLHDRLFRLLWEYDPYGLVTKLTNYLLSELAIGVLVIATSEIYFDRQITIKDTLQRFINIYPRNLAYLFIYLIPLSLPSFILNIMVEAISYLPPVVILSLYLLTHFVCIYFIITWLLYAPVIVVEGSRKPKPMNRSRDLMKKTWWRVFSIIFMLKILLRSIRLIFIVSFVLLLSSIGLMGDAPVLEIVEYVFRSDIGLYSGSLPFDSKSISYVIHMSLYTVIGILIKPLYAITITLIYFNQRVRREGFDIEMVALQDSTLRPQPK